MPPSPSPAGHTLRTVARRLVALPRDALIVLVRGYRLLISPALGNVCRYEPSCSQYALGALQRHGAVAGSALAGWRVLRCNPWCLGGCDPVPQRAPGLFRHLGLGADDPPGTALNPDLRKS